MSENSVNDERTCCVYGCLQSRRTNLDYSFIDLPTDRYRRNKWLEIINRADLMKQADLKPNSYSVCSHHFEERMLRETKFVLSDAVPCKNLPDATGNEMNQRQALSLVSSSIDPEAITFGPSANVAKPKTNKTVKTVLAPTTLIIPGLQDDFSKSFSKFIEEQVKIQRNIEKYSKGFLFYALNMYLLNPQAYLFVKDTLDLPDERVIKNIKLKLSPKIDNRVLDCLASKLKSLPDKAKYCNVCVNTVRLTKHLYYDTLNDEVVGLQDIKGQKSQQCAEFAYVAMLRGLLVKWDQPVAYCFFSSVKNIHQLASWIDDTLEQLFEIGFKIMAIVTNQGSNMVKFAQEIKGISPKRTYFEVNGKKVYYIFEAPQLLQCFRDDLMTKDIYYNDKRASWEHIKALYNLESNNKHSLIPKITSGHIMPNNDHSTVVTLSQEIFSKEVSDAIHSHVDMNTLPEEARHTANFCLMLSNLHDVLNSKTYRNENIYKCAFGSHESQKKVIVDFLRLLDTLVCKNFGKNKKKCHFSSLPEMQVTLHSILSLIKDLNDLGYKYILTDRLNLNPLRDFMNLAKRMMNGDETSLSLTPVQFCRNFAKLFIKYISFKSTHSIKPKAFEKFFEDAARWEVNRLTPVPSVRSQVSLDGDTGYRITLPDDFQTIYIASYLFYKCEKLHNCVKLKKYAKTLRDLTKSKAYDKMNQNEKFYGKLKFLHLPFVSYIEELEKVLLQNFHSALCLKLGAELFRVMKNVPFNPPCPCFPTNYLITLLIRLRTYCTIKKYNKTKNMSVSDFLTQLCKKNK